MFKFVYWLILTSIIDLNIASISHSVATENPEVKAYSCDLAFADDVAGLANSQQSGHELTSLQSFLAKYKDNLELKSDLVLLLTQLKNINQDEEVVFYYCSSKAYANLQKPSLKSMQLIEATIEKIGSSNPKTLE
ncbi:hypothetical protein FLL45_18560 [Aliikangiella marina]|uniref:Uncharacterized protein n=1 Tax=Aliikangiella marina TaxID=1712262 RepID=A0A545T4Y1_9GAMM|nr:hypothetical protein [Aliikangiella marina]TQV72222.1 hypothetical protein FLL45_18560 [Aliikangiella marina]